MASVVVGDCDHGHPVPPVVGTAPLPPVPELPAADPLPAALPVRIKYQ